MPKHFKVHELLTRDELDQLEGFAREPGRTVDEIHQWLLERGFTLSRGAAWNWHREFLATDRFKAANDVARNMVRGADKEGVVALAEAASLQLQQMVLEKLLEMQIEGKVTTEDLRGLSLATTRVIGGKRQIGKLLQEKFDAEMAERQKERPDRMVTPEALDLARKRIFG